MSPFDYVVEVQRLIPPLGDNLFVAKARLVREVVPVDPWPVGEHWARIDSEAHSKAEVAIEAWIAGHARGTA